MNHELKMVFNHQNLLDVAVKMTHSFSSMYVLAPTLPGLITSFFFQTSALLTNGPGNCWVRERQQELPFPSLTPLYIPFDVLLQNQRSAVLFVSIGTVCLSLEAKVISRHMKSLPQLPLLLLLLRTAYVNNALVNFRVV